MEQKNISFGRGIQRSPSLAAEGGELSECVNLIPKNGELVNLQPAEVIEDIPCMRDYHLVGKHNVVNYPRLLFVRRNAVLNKPARATRQSNPIHIEYLYTDSTWQTQIYAELVPASAIELVLTLDLQNGEKIRKYVTLQPEEDDFSDFSFRAVLNLAEEPVIYSVTLEKGDDVYDYNRWILAQGYYENAETMGEGTIITEGDVPGTPDTPEEEDPAVPGDSQTLLWYDTTNLKIRTVGFINGNVIQVESMGNMVIVLTDSCKYIFLWNGKLYTRIDNIPAIGMDFSLDLSYERNNYENQIKIGKVTSAEVYEFVDSMDYDFGSAAGQPHSVTTTHFNDKLQPGKIYRFHSDSAIRVTLYLKTGGVFTMELYNATNFEYIGAWYDVDNIKIEPYYITSKYHGTLYVYERNISDVESGFINEEDNFEAVLGSANDFISLQHKFTHKFIFPFFIKYGIRLLDGDGTVINQSSPILMIPNWGNVPMVATTSEPNKDGMTSIMVSAFAAGIHYKIRESLAKLNDYKDVVSGITIAVSAPIYKYNQGQLFNTHMNFVKTDDVNEMTLSDLYALDQNGMRKHWDEIKDLNLKKRIILPEFNEGEYIGNISDKSTFYIIKEFTLEELATSGTLDLSKINIQNITTLQQMPEDATSQNVILPQSMFIYNGRLSVANIRESINPSQDMVSPLLIDKDSSYKMYVEFTENAEMMSYVTEESNGYSLDNARWVYVPQSDVEQILLLSRVNTGGTIKYSKRSLSFKTHDMLKGTYALLDQQSHSPVIITEDEYCGYTTNNIIYKKNTICTSLTDNPLAFPYSLRSNVGSGEILKVSTSAKALSSGTQHGAFPLICFADDGVWHMKVNSDGTYSTPNPTSRDILSNKESVVQLDSAVVFATDRGLMKIDGSSVKLLSGSMEGENVNEDIFFADLKGTEHGQLIVRDTESLVSMLKDCKTLWDYSKGLIHLYIGSRKHYVYSTEADEWAEYVSEESNPVSVVHDYPYSILQRADGQLMQYRKNENLEVKRNGIILTRETAFDDPFTMKMLADLRMLYTKHKGTKCSIMVFVSNDREHWHALKSLRSHSWKWYRFRIRTMLTDLDALSGLSCWVEARRTNKLR